MKYAVDVNALSPCTHMPLSVSRLEPLLASRNAAMCTSALVYGCAPINLYVVSLFIDQSMTIINMIMIIP